MSDIQLLIVDDEEDGAILSARQIERSGHEVNWLRVDTEAAMRKALSEQTWDIVLSDHIMPHFDAFAALKLLKSLELITPLVVVSGRIGEETAVELMRAGAAHYVSKDNVSRLSVVMNHVLADRQEHQQQVQQDKTRLAASRMEVAHTLAGGLSHEFNNLMVGVVTTSEILLQRDNEPPENQRLLQMIYDSGIRAVQVSRQLLAYAQGAKFNVSTIHVESLIHQALERIQHLSQDNTHITLELLQDSGHVEGDKAQLSQLLEGILHNAIEAMPHGGDICVSTFQHTQQHQQNHLDAGQYIGIGIRDTGVGMESDQLAHVFEPFYTTKFLGRGLGLAAAWGIAQSHDGHIEVSSVMGEGSCFSVLLPVKMEQEHHHETLNTETPHTYTDKKTILLVEDNEVVISVTSTLLRHWGHSIFLAKNAKQALIQAQEKSEHIDLIILDLGLPDRSGGDIIGELRGLIPQAPVLIVSGYPANDKVHELLEMENTAFLKKPFSPIEVSEKIHHLFAGL
ncbi:MAG: response regulator [Mariprofundaceae bacterium]|nr:response regulator [Mariprofundaceae bacterium]